MTITLDGLNINTTSTPTSGYLAVEPLDWGSKAISDIVNSGQYRLEDMDAVLAAGRVLRQVVIPLRIIGTSSDDLDSKISALNVKVSKASRFTPVDLVVTPQGSSASSTFKVVGGSIVDGSWDKTTDVFFRVVYNLILQTLPFVYGAKQSLGSSGSPLLASTATPAQFTVIPAALGDVLADVTIIVKPTNDIKTLMVSCISGVSSWTPYLDFSTFTNGDAGVNYLTVTNAKYKGGVGPSILIAGPPGPTNNVFKILSQTISASDLPVNTPFRMFAIVDDFSISAGTRAAVQFRARLSMGQTIIGDWCSVPPGAYSGSNHYSQCIDLGTFVFPPEPTASGVSLTASATISIDMQETQAVGTPLVFDSLLFVPDLSSIVAETPGSFVNHSNGARVENDLVFDQATGASLNVAISGAHVRCRGTTKYTVYGSVETMASQVNNMTYETMTAWAEYTPRWLGLAPA